MRFNLYLAISILIVLVTASCSNRAAKSPTAVYFQSLPPDMVFVPGNGQVPSFYMGVGEETNLDYNIYLGWLEKVHGKHSEIHQWATPGDSSFFDDSAQIFNDPAYREYFTHPAYAHYPVVGVTWLQAMEYLSWKGDRLNEAALVRAGINAENNIGPFTVDNTFNLEAYLNGQYDPIVKGYIDKPVPKQDDIRIDGNYYWYTHRGRTYRTVMRDGILYSPMRLPTEAEWDYILTMQASANSRSFKKPVAANYLVIYDTAFKMGLTTKAQLNNQPFEGFGTSLTTPAGLYTSMKGGADEWLLDVYANKTPVQVSDITDFLTAQGIKEMDEEGQLDADGLLVDKNSLGRFPFTYYSFSQTGEGIWHRRYTIFHDEYMTHTIDTIYTDLDTSNIDTLRYFTRPSYNPHSGKRDGKKEYVLKDKYAERTLTKGPKGYFFWIPREYRDFEKIKKEHSDRIRTVITSAGKTGMNENAFNFKTGFRAVMWHTGYPLVNKKYRVKW